MTLSNLLPGPSVSSKQVAKNLPKLLPSQIYKAERSLVKLYRDGQFYCTGVVIGANYLLTAAHCLVDENGVMTKQPVLVVNDDGSVKSVGRAVGVSVRVDHALIMGDFSKIPGAKVISDHMNIPPVVVACGYPLGAPIVDCSILVPRINDAFLIKCSGGPLMPGQSGGPVFDKDSNVVGLNVQVYGVDQGGGVGYTPTSGILGEFAIE